MCVCLELNQNEYKIKQFYELLFLQILLLWFAGQKVLQRLFSFTVNVARLLEKRAPLDGSKKSTKMKLKINFAIRIIVD